MARRYRKYRGRKRFPRRKAKARAKSTKTGGGYNRNAPAQLSIVRGLGFPARMRTILRYTADLGLTSAAGVMTTTSFSANGIYDPDLTGVGHQPMYFDQYMAVYNKYKVLGSKLTCVGGNIASGAEPAYVTCYLDDDGTATSSSIQQIVELGKVKRVFQMGGVHTTPIILRSSFSAKVMFKDKFEAAQMSGDAGSNPTEIAAYIFVLQPHAGFTGNNTFVGQVTIDYIVDFYELKETSQS